MFFFSHSCFPQATGRDRSDSVLRRRVEHDREGRHPLARYLRHWTQCQNRRNIPGDLSRQRSRSGAEIGQTLDRWPTGKSPDLPLRLPFAASMKKLIQVLHSASQVLDVYDCTLGLLRIGPFNYDPLRGVDLWLAQSDHLILQHLSTSPEVEPPHFVSRVNILVELCRTEFCALRMKDSLSQLERSPFQLPRCCTFHNFIHARRLYIFLKFFIETSLKFLNEQLQLPGYDFSCLSASFEFIKFLAQV